MSAVSAEFAPACTRRRRRSRLALRKCAAVRLTNGLRLQLHPGVRPQSAGDRCLIRGGGKDIPGVRYHVIADARCSPRSRRQQGRSKYGQAAQKGGTRRGSQKVLAKKLGGLKAEMPRKGQIAKHPCHNDRIRSKICDEFYQLDIGGQARPRGHFYEASLSEEKGGRP